MICTDAPGSGNILAGHGTRYHGPQWDPPERDFDHLPKSRGTSDEYTTMKP